MDCFCALMTILWSRFACYQRPGSNLHLTWVRYDAYSSFVASRRSSARIRPILQLITNTMTRTFQTARLCNRYPV
jgi:hypothetical protein